MSIQEDIRSKLEDALSPEYLEVVNDSHTHVGHSGDDGTGETHFRVLVSSVALTRTNKVEAHRLIHDILKKETKIAHSLSIKIK